MWKFLLYATSVKSNSVIAFIVVSLSLLFMTVFCSQSALPSEFCMQQITSNDSCFNQFIHNHFDFKGLPGSSQDLLTFCNAYESGMKCLDKFVDACLGNGDKSFYERRMAPVRSVMTQLCSKSDFQDEFLRHASCYKKLSDDWNVCAMPIRKLLKEEENQGGRSGSGSVGGGGGEDGRAKIYKICLIKRQFVNCTISATKEKCDKSAVNILLKLAETLSGSQGNEECPMDLSMMQSEASNPQKTVGSTSVKVSSRNTLILFFAFIVVVLSSIELFV